MSLQKTLITITAALGLCASASADLSYTFNTDAEGFNNVSWQAAAPPGWSGIPAVMQTHAAGGWQMLNTKEFAWGPGGGSANQQLEMQALANLGANARLSFDAMVDFNSFPPGVPTWYQFWLVGNSDGSAGWTQTQLIDAYQNPGQADLRTWHFDLAFSQVGWQPGDTWFQISTGCNSDGSVPVNFYMDNFVLYAVPEPGALALVGLGAVALLAFRRRN